MLNPTIELTLQEKSLIEDALNSYFHDAHKQLEDNMFNRQKRGLGDIEKKQLEKRVELIKLLCTRFTNI